MSDTYIYDKTVTEDGEVIESENVTKVITKKYIFITNGVGGCGFLLMWTSLVTVLIMQFS